MLIGDVIPQMQSRSCYIASERFRVAATHSRSHLWCFPYLKFTVWYPYDYSREREQEHLWILKMNEKEISGAGVGRHCPFHIPAPIFQKAKGVKCKWHHFFSYPFYLGRLFCFYQWSFLCWWYILKNRIRGLPNDMEKMKSKLEGRFNQLEWFPFFIWLDLTHQRAESGVLSSEVAVIPLVTWEWVTAMHWQTHCKCNWLKEGEQLPIPVVIGCFVLPCFFVCWEWSLIPSQGSWGVWPRLYKLLETGFDFWECPS